LAAAILVVTHIAEKQMEEIMQTPSDLVIDLNDIEDGVYVGEVKTIPIHVIVKVTIKNHQIVEIKIIEHRSGQGEPAEVIVEDIIAYQSLNVDLISGATYSSKVIILAVYKAVNYPPLYRSVGFLSKPM
jgi:uncharacterized protein with FMN-binding domain